MAYLMEDRLKDVAEEVDKEKALKDVTEATVKEKTTAAKNVKARAWEAKRAQSQVDQQRAKAETKLGEVELRVASVESIITARDKEIAELKVALEESENKYYDMGFNDANLR